MTYTVNRKKDNSQEKLIVFIETKNGKSNGHFLFQKQNGNTLSEYKSNNILASDEWTVMRTIVFDINNYLTSNYIAPGDMVNRCWEKFFYSKQAQLL